MTRSAAGRKRFRGGGGFAVQQKEEEEDDRRPANGGMKGWLKPVLGVAAAIGTTLGGIWIGSRYYGTNNTAAAQLGANVPGAIGSSAADQLLKPGPAAAGELATEQNALQRAPAPAPAPPPKPSKAMIRAFKEIKVLKAKQQQLQQKLDTTIAAAEENGGATRQTIGMVNALNNQLANVGNALEETIEHTKQLEAAAQSQRESVAALGSTVNVLGNQLGGVTEQTAQVGALALTAANTAASAQATADNNTVRTEQLRDALGNQQQNTDCQLQLIQQETLRNNAGLGDVHNALSAVTHTVEKQQLSLETLTNRATNPTVSQPLNDQLNTMRILMSDGRVEEAQAIWMKIQSSVGDIAQYSAGITNVRACLPPRTPSQKPRFRTKTIEGGPWETAISYGKPRFCAGVNTP